MSFIATNQKVFRFHAPTEKQKFSALIPLRGLFLLRASAKCASTLCARFGVGCPSGFAAPSQQSLQAVSALNLIAAFRFHAPTEKQKFSVFRFNPTAWAFLPCGSAKSASSLCSRSAASVPFSHCKRKPKNKSFPLSAFRFPFFTIFAKKKRLMANGQWLKAKELWVFCQQPSRRCVSSGGTMSI